MYKQYYSQFLEGTNYKVHLAAHSHHFWPDISQEGHNQYWLDSAKFSDEKWEHIFNRIVPSVQSHIARIIHFSRPSDIAFAPNTHELLYRLISSVEVNDRPLEILTTNSEFHSMGRQLHRLEEAKKVKLTIIDVDEQFEQNLISNAQNKFDLIMLSHVFFNSGKVIPWNVIKRLTEVAHKDALICLDAYHGFCAVVTDISEVEDRIFYLAGGYKYAQAGEGMCFMTLPNKTKLRPVNTGWFANYAGLSSESKEICYASDGMRFWGSTQDLSAHYRFKWVWDHFHKQDITVEKLDAHIKTLQLRFIQGLELRDKLLITDLNQCGHFLSLSCESEEKAKQFHTDLKKEKILTDYRGKTLRFGLGAYLDTHDIDYALTILNKTL